MCNHRGIPPRMDDRDARDARRANARARIRRRRAPPRAHGVGDPTGTVRRAAGQREQRRKQRLASVSRGGFAGAEAGAPRMILRILRHLPRVVLLFILGAVFDAFHAGVPRGRAYRRERRARRRRRPISAAGRVVVVVVAASRVDVSHRPGLDPRRANKLRHERVHDLALRLADVTRDVLEATQPAKRRRGDRAVNVLARL
mmetsp:Transcript_7554/g.29826  ORF Transcript_7554/g.29826 Transcript_7554/m.29826 type:complete len:201 (+) Transcript_7554:384-986(+)